MKNDHETDRVSIPTINGYMQKYAIDGIGKGADKNLVKEQLLDAFRRETFDTAIMMVGPSVFSDSYEPTEKDRNKLNNVIKNVNRKWKSLCKEFAKYRETENLIFEDDYAKYMSDRDEALREKSTTEYVTEEDIDNGKKENDETTDKEAVTSGGIKIEQGDADDGSDEGTRPEAE